MGIRYSYKTLTKDASHTQMIPGIHKGYLAYTKDVPGIHKGCLTYTKDAWESSSHPLKKRCTCEAHSNLEYSQSRGTRYSSRKLAAQITRPLVIELTTKFPIFTTYFASK